MIVLDRRLWRRCAVIPLAFVTTVLVAACGVSAREEERSAQSSQPTPVDRRREIVEKEATTTTPQRAPGVAPTTGTGEVPQPLLQLFRDDLVRRALVKPGTIAVVSATQQQWPDGSLGCPQPGQMYTQMVVPGYRVVLSTAGQTYAYHSDLRGRFVVCMDGRALPPVSDQVKQPPPAR